MVKFSNKKERITLLVENIILDKALSYCKLANNVETGGIIIGYYSNNYKTANITLFSKPPEDSKSTFNTFFRGVSKLGEFIKFLFKSNKHYYIGEWHYHPLNIVSYSDVDKEQMKSISNTPKYDCKEPILIILTPKSIGCYIFKNTLITLKRSKT